MEKNTFAYIESDKTRATKGVHLNCPNRRIVDGLSNYVCECTTPEVVAIANQGGYDSPNPLPAVH